MDHSWFRLDSPPFDDRADGRLFQSSPDREAVLEKLIQHVQFGKGVALLTAEAGMGKTMLLRALLLRLHATDHAVLLPWPAGSDRDAIRETCKRFGVGLPFSKDRARTFKRLRGHLRKTWEVGHRSILIVDQAENLTANQLSSLAEFATRSQDEAESLRIVLSGQPKLSRVLDRPEFTPFRQLIVISCGLSAMSSGETKEYIRARLIAAGHSTGDLFESQAVKLIHQTSGGVPRLVNAAAVRALQAARFAGEKRIRAVRIGAVATASVVAAGIGVDQPAPETGAATPVETASPTSHGIVGTAERSQRPPSRVYAASAAHGVFGVDAATAPVIVGYEARPSLIGELGREIAEYSSDRADVRETTLEAAPPDEIQRLEQLVHRAEYAIATLDGSVRESVVAADRLTFVRDRVERLTAELTASADRATETVSTVNLRAEAVIDETDRRVTEVRGRIAGALDALAESEPFQRMQRACARVDEIEGRLNAFADDLARRSDEQIARAAALTERMDRAVALERRLEAMLERAESAPQEIEARWKRFLAESERERQSAEAEARAVIEDIRGAAREAGAQWAAATGDLERRATELHSKIAESKRVAQDVERDTLVRLKEKARQVVDAESERAARELSRLQDASAAVAERLSGTVEDARAACDQVQETMSTIGGKTREQMTQWREESTTLAERMTEAQQFLNERVKELSAEGKQQAEFWTTRIRQLRELAGATEAETVEAIERTRAEITRAAGELEAGLSARLESRSRETEAAIEAWSTRLKELHTRSTAGAAQAGEMIERVRLELAELSAERTRRIDELQHYLTALDGRFGHVQFQFAELDETAKSLAAKVEQWESAIVAPTRSLETGVSRAETVNRELSSSVRRAEDLQAGTKESVGRLEALRHAVSSTLVDLGAAHERVRPLVDNLTDAESRANTVQAACAEARETERRMESLVDTSKRLRDALDLSVTRADEKSKKLDSHHAAASLTLQQLSSATKEGRTLIDQSVETARTAEAKAVRAREQIESLVDGVRELTAAVESRVVELNAATARSDDVVKKMSEWAGQRDTLQHTLIEQARIAEESIRRMQEHTMQSAALADKLSEVGAYLGRAEDAQHTLRQAIAEAARLHADLAAAGDSGSVQCNELQTVTAEARTLVEAQRDAVKRIEEAVSGWDDRLSESRDTVEAAERLRREFTAQAEDLGAKLDGMRRMAAQVEEKVAAIVTRPNEVIAVAQHQAAQLERVCGVVRKVFAGLSQTSLDAVNKSREFQQISEAAAKRLAALRHETDRATSTLHEWVAEAVRVQARLEKLLHQAPSISATHPGGALLDVSQRLQTSEADAASRILSSLAGTGSEGELKILPSPPAVRPVSAAARQATVSASRMAGDRVAAMIEEAKAASGVEAAS